MSETGNNNNNKATNSWFIFALVFAVIGTIFYYNFNHISSLFNFVKSNNGSSSDTTTESDLLITVNKETGTITGTTINENSNTTSESGTSTLTLESGTSTLTSESGTSTLTSESGTSTLTSESGTSTLTSESSDSGSDVSPKGSGQPMHKYNTNAGSDKYAYSIKLGERRLPETKDLSNDNMVYIYYNQIKNENGNANTIIDCKNACNNEPSCEGFEFNVRDNTCVLNDDNLKETQMSLFDSGEKQDCKTDYFKRADNKETTDNIIEYVPGKGMRETTQINNQALDTMDRDVLEKNKKCVTKDLRKVVLNSTGSYGLDGTIRNTNWSSTNPYHTAWDGDNCFNKLWEVPGYKAFVKRLDGDTYLRGSMPGACIFYKDTNFTENHSHSRNPNYFMTIKKDYTGRPPPFYVY